MATRSTSVFDHFKVPQESTSLGNFKAECCKLISGSHKATSNFITHLQRKHPDVHKKLEKSNSSPTQEKITSFAMEQKKQMKGKLL